jgi:2-iminobutanoate/2-iminopropanoate deaminase
MNQAGPNPLAFTADWEFSQSMICDGELIFTSGQGGFGPDGEVVDPEDFEAQLRQAYANLATVLEAAGASLDTVVKMTVYLGRAEDYDTFTRVRHEVFTPPYPASTAVEGRFLFDGMLVEMDAVARVGERRTPHSAD